MDYDADKTEQILGPVRLAMEKGRLKAAMQLLRHADAGGGLQREPGLLEDLAEQLGDPHARALVEAFAQEACPYCSGGREKCEDCAGEGSYDEVRICEPCSGLGLQRCPFCNGTSFAGYDFVPAGLRPAIMSARLETAGKQIDELRRMASRPGDGAREIARHILSLDRCRGILANAVEQLHQGSSGAARALYPPARRKAVEKECGRQNVLAEDAIRALLVSLAGHYARKAERPNQDPDTRTLLAARAKAFAKLGRGADFGGSVLRTPAALR